MTAAPSDYEIRVQGHLDHTWTGWFPGMTLAHHRDGTTTLVGPVTDQSELHGVLARVRDVGVPLVSVARVSRPDPVAGGGPATYGDCIPRGGRP